jgi:imidazoleglycerol phosphate synthase glutamine amidotransferase subunit HisH
VNAAICDYGAGNVRSVQVALERLDTYAVVTHDPAEVLRADGSLDRPKLGSIVSNDRRMAFCVDTCTISC